MASPLDARVTDMLRNVRLADAMRGPVAATPESIANTRAMLARASLTSSAPMAAPAAAPAAAVANAPTLKARIAQVTGQPAAAAAAATRSAAPAFLPRTVLGKLGALGAAASLVGTQASLLDPNSNLRLMANETMRPTREALQAGRYGEAYLQSFPGTAKTALAVGADLVGVGGLAADFMGVRRAATPPTATATPNGAAPANMVAAQTAAPPSPAEAASGYSLEDIVRSSKNLTPRQMQLLASVTPKPVSAKDQAYGVINAAATKRFNADIESAATQEDILKANQRLIDTLSAVLGNNPLEGRLDLYDEQAR